MGRNSPCRVSGTSAQFHKQAVQSVPCPYPRSGNTGAGPRSLRVESGPVFYRPSNHPKRA